MKKYEFIGKNIDSLKEQAIEELKTTDLLFLEEENIKQNLFSSKKQKIVVYKKEDISEYVRNILYDTTKMIGIDIKIETKIRDNHIYFKMLSDNNSILIGRNGQTLAALQQLIKQNLYLNFLISINIMLDVAEYKEKQNRYVEILAKKSANDVIKTKIDIKLDSMNSYQRRIVHEVLSNFKNIKSISEGEEPNRYVVIKYKED